MTARSEALFNKARLSQKYCGGGKVSVTIGTITGTGILSDVSTTKDLEDGGFVSDIDAELHVRQCQFATAPANGSTLTANGSTYRVTGVTDDHRMDEWVINLQAQHR